MLEQFLRAPEDFPVSQDLLGEMGRALERPRVAEEPWITRLFDGPAVSEQHRSWRSFILRNLVFSERLPPSLVAGLVEQELDLLRIQDVPGAVPLLLAEVAAHRSPTPGRLWRTPAVERALAAQLCATQTPVDFRSAVPEPVPRAHLLERLMLLATKDMSLRPCHDGRYPTELTLEWLRSLGDAQWTLRAPGQGLGLQAPPHFDPGAEPRVARGLRVLLTSSPGGFAPRLGPGEEASQRAWVTWLVAEAAVETLPRAVVARQLLQLQADPVEHYAQLSLPGSPRHQREVLRRWCKAATASPLSVLRAQAWGEVTDGQSGTTMDLLFCARDNLSHAAWRQALLPVLPILRGDNLLQLVPLLVERWPEQELAAVREPLLSSARWDQRLAWWLGQWRRVALAASDAQQREVLSHVVEEIAQAPLATEAESTELRRAVTAALEELDGKVIPEQAKVAERLRAVTLARPHLTETQRALLSLAAQEIESYVVRGWAFSI